MSQADVNKTAWPWRSPKAALADHTPKKGRALIMAVILMAIAAFVFWKGRNHPHARYLAIVPFLAAMATLVGAFIYPPLDRAMAGFAAKLTHWVATGLTWGLLTPFYYICFALGHLVLKLRGKDPMRRRFRTQDTTFWQPRPPVKDVAQYERQF